MKSHLSEDSDDENCEDPIRLFDNNINAVYFGSRPLTHGVREDTEIRWTLEQFAKNEFCQSIQNSTLRGPDDELLQTLQSSQTSECDISSLSVKLVDCGKFPWYFRKYTQQIMQKINTTEHSDSENETDVEGVADDSDDSDDCVIVEVHDITNEIIKYDQNYQPIVESRKNDKELQRALSIKNLVKVDFKRNQGLVGMKVTPKLPTLTTLDVLIDRKQMVEEADSNQNSVMIDEKVVSAADRTLSHIIGTQLMPLKDEIASNTKQFKSNNKDLGEKPSIIKSSSCQNVTVQFESKKIFEKLIDNLKATKTNDQSSEGKLVSKVPNTSLLKKPENKLNIFDEKKIDSKITIKEKYTNISIEEISHEEDVKITCENKNDQVKIKSNIHNPWIGHLIKKKNKKADIKEIKCPKQRRRNVTKSIANTLDKKPRKKTDKQKNEPKSPILHCSTVPKKPKHKIPHKCNEANTNSNPPKESFKLTKIVDRLSNLNSCNLMNEATTIGTTIPKHVISKAPVTKPLDVTNKQALQKESSIIQNKTTSIVSNIHTKSSIVPERLPKKYNESKTDLRRNNFQNAPIMPSQNKTYEENLLRETHQIVNKQKIDSFPITNSTLKAPNKNNNKPLSNSNDLTSTLITSTSGSNSAPSVNSNFPNNYGTHYRIHNAAPNKMSNNNVPNNNINSSQQNTNLPNNYGSRCHTQNALPNRMNDNNVSSKNINPSDQKTNLPNNNRSHYPIHNALPNKMSDSNISNKNINSSNQNTNLPNNNGSHYPIHNAVPNKMSDNNISNNNFNSSNQNTNLPNSYGSRYPTHNALPNKINDNVSSKNINPSDQKTNLPNNYGSRYPTHNALPNKMSDNNISNKNINASVQNTNLPNSYGSHYPTHNALPNKINDNNVSSKNINPSDKKTNLPNNNRSHYPIHNAAPNKMSDSNISNNNINLSDQYTNFPNYYESHYPIHNALTNIMCDNNIFNNNINVPVQNPYASAIILKSNNNTNFPYEKFREPPKQPMTPQSQRPINILHSRSQSRDSRSPFTVFYPPAPSQSLPSNFLSPTNRFPNQFHPPHAHLAQQPSYTMQNLYRKCWLPQNTAPPPPPPPSVPPPPPPPSAPPTSNSPRNGHDVAKSKNYSYLNRPSASVMQCLQKHQNSINSLETKNNSIIGINTNGFVKRINIVAMSAKTNVETKNGTVEVEQKTNLQTMSPLEDSNKVVATKTDISAKTNVDTKNGTVEVEQKTNPQTMSLLDDSSKVVATKTEMLQELDKLSFVDENISNFKAIYPGKIDREDKKENTLEVAILSKNPGRFETLKLTMNNKDNTPIQQKKTAKGYSPPILPIPTYQKVLDKVMPNLQAATPNIALRAGDPRSIIRNESKPMRKRDFVKCGKRKLNTCQDNKKKEDAKKISLDEYKQRKLQNDSKPQLNKRICKEKYNYNGNRPNVECKLRKNVDCCNTETDLGYDSDSTAVL